jgi:hypothetical protein
MTFDAAQWRAAWDELLMKLDADQLDIIKRSASGDVLAGELNLGGRPIPVIVKRPRRKYLYRYLTAFGRPRRVMRMWTKAWKLYIRNIPAEFPLLVMEKRTLGYVTDGVIVFERTAGATLATIDLATLDSAGRETMFRRVGRILRKLEGLGFAHFDAKATNWIIRLMKSLAPRRSSSTWTACGIIPGAAKASAVCFEACATIRNTLRRIRWRCAAGMLRGQDSCGKKSNHRMNTDEHR